jgi:hypothetical protein
MDGVADSQFLATLLTSVSGPGCSIIFATDGRSFDLDCLHKKALPWVQLGEEEEDLR